MIPNQPDPAAEGQCRSRSTAQGGEQRVAMGMALRLEADMQFTLQLVQALRYSRPSGEIVVREAFEFVEGGWRSGMRRASRRRRLVTRAPAQAVASSPCARAANRLIVKKRVEYKAPQLVVAPEAQAGGSVLECCELASHAVRQQPIRAALGEPLERSVRQLRDHVVSIGHLRDLVVCSVSVIGRGLIKRAGTRKLSPLRSKTHSAESESVD